MTRVRWSVLVFFPSKSYPSLSFIIFIFNMTSCTDATLIQIKDVKTNVYELLYISEVIMFLPHSTV